jgi:predicted O-methyltransferase YrrM
MNPETWSAAEAYFVEKVIKPDPSYQAIYDASVAAGLPDIAVSAAEGKQLQLMAKMCGAKRILEIGTLGGYSTLWLARALPPGGKLVTLEFNPKHAEVARANLAKAGVGDVVEVITGSALDTLPTLTGPFDFFFLDANKDGYPDYFRWAMKLSRPGSVIVADNVVREGRVVDANSDNALIQGVRRMMDAVDAEPRVSASVIQTVGSRGYDGYLVAVVTG